MREHRRSPPLAIFMNLLYPFLQMKTTLFEELVDSAAAEYRRKKKAPFSNTVRHVIRQSGFGEDDTLTSRVCSALGKRGAEKRNRLKMAEAPPPPPKPAYVSMQERVRLMVAELSPEERFLRHMQALRR